MTTSMGRRSSCWRPRSTRRAGRAGTSGRCVIGQIGLGAAGIGIVRLLMRAGAASVIGTDLDDGARRRLVAMGGQPASLEEIMRKSDIVIATTGVRGLIKPEIREERARSSWRCRTPTRKSSPRSRFSTARRSPRTARESTTCSGSRDCSRARSPSRAPRFTDAMLLAARRKIAELAQGDELVPDALDLDVHQAVAAAVKRGAV